MPEPTESAWTRDPPPYVSWMKPDWTDGCTLVGRVLIAALFAAGAAQKVAEPAPVQAMLTGIGLPALLVWPVAAANAAAALALVAGCAVRPIAAGLAAYCAGTSYFHFIPEDPWQMSIVVKNWAIAGGCLVLAAHGAGRLRLRARHIGLGWR